MASSYEEPDLSNFLALFSAENEGEEVERDFVEGCTQMMRGNLDEALILFNKVLEADPDNHPAQYNSARIYHEQKSYDKAVDLAQQAVTGQPENYWYYKFLVRALGSKGDINRAIEIQETMVDKFPAHTEDKMDLADLYFKNGQQDQGLKTLSRIEKERGINPMVSLRKYEIYKANGDDEAALQSVQNLIETGDTSPDIFHRQYETLQKLGRQEEAALSLEALLELDPENGFALLSLADYYKRQDLIAKSDEFLFRAFALPNIEPQGKARIIDQLIPYAQSDAGVKTRLDKLVELFNQAHPNNPETLILKGKLAENGEANPANLDSFREILEKNPRQINLWLKLLEQSYQNKDFEQLNKDAELALEYYPNQAEFLFYYGKSSAVKLNYSAGIYAFNKLKKIAGENKILSAVASLELGSLLKNQGKPDESKVNLDEANKLLDEAKKLNPEDPRVYELLGDYYALLGVPELSEQQWTTAIKKGATFTIEDKLESFGYKKE